jgi:hypothetical protein
MKDKLLDRIWEPSASDGWDAPPKPKWMRWWTYERLSKRREKYSNDARCATANVLARRRCGLGRLHLGNMLANSVLAH